MGSYFLVIISMVFVQNYVLSQILGLCPFINVSRKTDSALGMGIAVTFVMAMTSAVTWPLYFYVLDLKTGKKLQELFLDSAVTGSLAVGPDCILVGTDKGVLYCLGTKAK